MLYRRAGDNLFYGKARLKSIDYGFDRCLLTMVTLRAHSLLHYLLMKEEAFSRLGKGKDVDVFSERFAWEEERTKIMLISGFDMSRDGAHGEGFLVMERKESMTTSKGIS